MRVDHVHALRMELRLDLLDLRHLRANREQRELLIGVGNAASVSVVASAVLAKKADG